MIIVIDEAYMEREDIRQQQVGKHHGSNGKSLDRSQPRCLRPSGTRSALETSPKLFDCQKQARAFAFPGIWTSTQMTGWY